MSLDMKAMAQGKRGVQGKIEADRVISYRREDLHYTITKRAINTAILGGSGVSLPL